MNQVKDTHHSAIYSGQVFHRRFLQKSHQFRYSLFMLYIDLAEVPKLPSISRLISLSKWAPISFQESDYLSHALGKTLKERVNGEILRLFNDTWTGEVRILTQPRWFGLIMNPLTLYYCFNAHNSLEFILGEITNTPWNERHVYGFKASKDETVTHSCFDKIFHVSPFLPMDMNYTWRLSMPSEHLSVSISNHIGSKLEFEAHLTLKRHPLSSITILREMMHSPWMTLTIAFGIYWQAFVLFVIKKIKFYPHPKNNIPSNVS